jgi:CRISPR-associated protein Csx17
MNLPSEIATQSEITLDGCAPTPLASYLKALGILRLVTEQADPNARGCWRDEAFVLVTTLDVQALERFFLEDYAPTPVLAPWNGGSGFFFREEKLREVDPATGKKIKTGRRTEPTEATRTMDTLLSGVSARLALYREAALVAKNILRDIRMEEAPKEDDKDKLLLHLRAEFPDSALQCMDAALVLTEAKTKYPPLLGTGGTDGNLDFTNNFLQRILAVIDSETGCAVQGASELLKVSLFGEAQPGLPLAAVGQFAPGSAGGPNQTAGFEAKARVNPWDFILMLEGALLFAAAATRRLEGSAPSALSFPFTVRATGAGSGGTALGDEANARAEVWMPLWKAPSTLAELKALLAEGRVTLGRRPARDGLDFVRAAATLGVERGITEFQRYAFLMRSGKAYFATPLNRVTVRRNRAGDIIAELDAGGWLGRFRRFGRSDGAARVGSLVRRLDDALFALASGDDRDTTPAVQRVLMLLGEVQRYLAASPKAREACPPVPMLSEQWVLQAQDASAEFALAAGLSSLHAHAGDEGGRDALPMRAHLAPERRDGRRYVWDDNAAHQVTWGPGTVEDNLIAVLWRRLREVGRAQLSDKPFAFSRAAPLAAVAAWLGGGVDGARLAALIPGLMLARIPRGLTRKADEIGVPLPAAYRLLKPFFCTDAQLRQVELLPAEGALPVSSEMVRRLSAGQVAAVLDNAVRRLRAHGVNIDLRGFERGSADFPDGRRLLAALLVPISHQDLRDLLPRSESNNRPDHD